MTNANQSLISVTAELQYQGILERVFFSSLITLPCCVFLYINGIMLVTLRSKTVFCETSRYVLLYNLLFADTVLMALSQLLYIIAVLRYKLTYPVCGFLSMLSNLTAVISPLTLVAMSLERCVAVCYPLRHAAIVNLKNTVVAIIVIWTISSLNVFTKVLLLLRFPFEELDTLQMEEFCSYVALFLDPVSAVYDQAFMYVVFVSAGVSVISTYIGVLVAARSASSDKVSARKVRNTLLLHLVQLGLSLLSTIYSPMLKGIAQIVTRIVLVRIQNILDVIIIMFPRCLSSLIYGLRDQSIRPILMYYLCCRLKRSVTVTKATASIHVSH